MRKKQDIKGRNKGVSLFFSIMLVFCILGIIVISVSHKISKEMGASAVQNLSETLDLIESTIFVSGDFK